MTKILDCTIRDGGHLNGWNFADDCVRETFEAAKRSGVDYFETGYRNHGDGKFAQCKDNDLRKLLPDKGNLKLCLMVNAREFASEHFHSDDYADTVRIACHPNEIKIGVEYCKILKDKGYETILHLMDVAHITAEQFDTLKGYDNREVLYFADSYGSLLPEDIRASFKLFQGQGFEKIGFHGHNNKQLAFINSLTAMDCGAYAVDVTVYGMGRGAGNTPAELFLSQIGKPCGAYFDLIQKYYLDLYAENSWGYSIANLGGGIRNCKV